MNKYYKYNTPDLWTSLCAARQLLSFVIEQKIHSSCEVRGWKDPWILTTSAKLACPNVPLVHPRMTVNDFIRDDPKKWDVKMPVHFVVLEDIPLIRSLATSRTTHRDNYCLSFTKSD